MPGDISQSYDPDREFNDDERDIVIEGIAQVRDQITEYIGTDGLLNIVKLCADGGGHVINSYKFTERELRIIRFCLNDVIETI